jgi:hypothetical protein
MDMDLGLKATKIPLGPMGLAKIPLDLLRHTEQRICCFVVFAVNDLVHDAG